MLKSQIEVYQIESRNPHLHEVKGEEHVQDMSYAALEVIYKSPLTPDYIKEEIMTDMVNRGLLEEGEPVTETVRYYPNIRTCKLDKFQQSLSNHEYYPFLDADISHYLDPLEEIHRDDKPNADELKPKSSLLEIK